MAEPAIDWGKIVQDGHLESWGEFNIPSDALCGGKPCYPYGADYGLSGYAHTGLDIASDIGSTIYAPFDGTVKCAGTGNGTASDGSNCGAFNDVFGQGNGRIEIENGDNALILGHSSTSNVTPGQKVKAGDVLGTSGGMNSPHTHLEARIPDNSTNSGWRIIDPRQMISTLGNVKGGSSSDGNIDFSHGFLTFGYIAMGAVLVFVGVRSLMSGTVLDIARTVLTKKAGKAGAAITKGTE